MLTFFQRRRIVCSFYPQPARWAPVSASVLASRKREPDPAPRILLRPSLRRGHTALAAGRSYTEAETGHTALPAGRSYPEGERTEKSAGRG